MNIVHKGECSMPKILENAKEVILREGQVMLKEQGYKKFSMRELAKKCEIGLGTVYNYFPSKQSIVNEIFICSWDYTLYELREIKKIEATFEEKIRLIYKSLERYLKDHIETFMEIMTDGKQSMKTNCKTEAYCKKDEVLKPAYDIVEEIIEIHKERKDIDISIDSSVMSIFIITNMVTIIRGIGYSLDDLIDIIKSR